MVRRHRTLNRVDPTLTIGGAGVGAEACAGGMLYGGRYLLAARMARLAAKLPPFWTSALRPGHSRASVVTAMDTLVLRAINASLPVAIDAQTLSDCLAGRIDADPWMPHLAAFFTELRVDVIEAFLAAHGVAYAVAAQAYERVTQSTGEYSTDVDTWFGYLACAPQAGSDLP